MTRHQWINATIPFNTQSKLAEKQILDDKGRELIGVYEICFKSISIKLFEAMNIHAVVCTNFLTSFELTSHGNLERNFSPLKFIALKGNKDSLILEEIDSSKTYLFSDVNTIKIWLQDFNKKRVNAEVYVLISYRRI